MVGIRSGDIDEVRVVDVGRDNARTDDGADVL